MTAGPPLRRLRRVASGAMAFAGVALLTFPTSAGAQDPRTQTDLLGYDLEASSAPVSVRFFDDFIPIPVDPGDPQFEATLSHTQTTLTSGPLSRAVASTVWPGGGVGDGFGALTCAFSPEPETCDDSVEYPVRANAEYPGSGPSSWTAANGVPEADIGMFADALGLDNVARAETVSVPGLEALIDVGAVRSRSETHVQDGQAVATTTADIADVSLLGGVIVLEGVTTTLRTVSDGEEASTSGETVVGGITIAGMPAKLTDTGVVIRADGEDQQEGEEEPSDPLGDLLGGLTEPIGDLLTSLTSDLLGQGVRDALGVSIRALNHTETIEGAVAEREATGVVVTLETAVLNDYLQPLLGAIGFGDLVGQLPEDLNDVKGLLLEVANLAPKVEIVLGQGFVASSASPPFEVPEVTPPPAPPPATPPPPATGGGTDTSNPPSTGVSLPPPTTGGTAAPPPTSVAPPATTAPPAVAQPAAEPLDIDDGLPLVLVGVLLLLGAVPTWGLRSLRESAVGVGAATGPDRPLPDLRGGA